MSPKGFLYLCVCLANKRHLSFCHFFKNTLTLVKTLCKTTTRKKYSLKDQILKLDVREKNVGKFNENEFFLSNLRYLIVIIFSSSRLVMTGGCVPTTVANPLPSASPCSFFPLRISRRSSWILLLICISGKIIYNPRLWRNSYRLRPALVQFLAQPTS